MITTTVSPYTLTVTAAGDGLHYKLDCDGVTDACRAWQECDALGCTTDALDRAEEDGDDEPVAHGVAHKSLNIGWAVPLEECWLKSDPDWPEPARELGVGPGVYRVVHTYNRDGEFYTLTVVGS